MRWITRRVVCLTAAAALSLGGSIWAPADAADPVVLHEFFPSKEAGFWPAFIAQNKGFYKQQDLQVEDVVVDPTLTVAGVISGSAEISVAGTVQSLVAIEKGAKLLAIGIEHDENEYKLMGSPGIKTIADLKGKKISIAAGVDVNPYTFVLRDMLSKNGVDPDKDVQWITGGDTNQRVSLLINGAVQATLVQAPLDMKLTGLGFTTIADTMDYYPRLAANVTEVRGDWATQHADALRRFLRAQSDAVKWLYEPANKAEALKILETEINATPAEAQEAYEFWVGRHAFPTNACVTKQGLDVVVKIMRQTGQLKTFSTNDLPKYMDTEFCPK